MTAGLPAVSAMSLAIARFLSALRVVGPQKRCGVGHVLQAVSLRVGEPPERGEDAEGHLLAGDVICLLRNGVIGICAPRDRRERYRTLSHRRLAHGRADDFDTMRLSVTE